MMAFRCVVRRKALVHRRVGKMLKLVAAGGVASITSQSCWMRCFAAPAQSLFERLETTIVSSEPVDLSDKGFIATHSGSFHADEVMACVMLQLLPKYQTLPIVRTRDPKTIDQATVVVDVGGVYDHDRCRYDHHQRSFTDTYSEKYNEIKLSSAGLIFKHFGAEVVQALCGPLDTRVQDKIVEMTYDSLIRELDAIDDGVEVADEPRYRFCTHLAARVSRLNLSWKNAHCHSAENARFKQAMRLAANDLADILEGYVYEWLPARAIVESALEERRQIHASGEIIKLERPCPWQDHLLELEQDLGNPAPLAVKYVLFQDRRDGWRVQAVPRERGSFETRKPLPQEWHGLRGEELSSKLGIPNCMFVHANGFIGGHSSEEGAHQMAVQALQSN